MFSRVHGIAFLILFLLSAAPAQSVISGQLLKADGKPLPYTEIELVPVSASKYVDDPRLNSISDARGNFKFTDLPRAKYTLSINFGEAPSELSPYDAFFYPNAAKRDDARIFDLTTAGVIDKLVFKLPPAIKFLAVTGSVRTFDGAVALRALVTIISMDGDNAEDFAFRSVGPKGEWRFGLVAGRRYRVVAVQFDERERVASGMPKIIGLAVSDVFTLERPGLKFDLKLIPNPTPEQIRLLVRDGNDVSAVSRPLRPLGD